MKWKLRSGLLCAATALAVGAAVLLPPRLSALADGRLSGAQYEISAENMDISLVTQLSTAERLALLGQITQENTFFLPNEEPVPGELTEQQALALCQEELDALYQAGGLPAPFSISSLQNAVYFALYDRENLQRSVSYWLLDVRSDDRSFFRANVFLDAETGLIYGVYLSYHAQPGYTISPPDLLTGWSAYLGLGEPDLTGIPSVFPDLILDTDDKTYVVVISPYTHSVEFQTDEGLPVTFTLGLSYSAYGYPETLQELMIAPFPEELL